MRDMLIYGYKDKTVELGLILFPFSRIIIVIPSLEPMTCMPIGSWSNNGTMHGFKLRYNQKMVAYFHHICAAVTPVDNHYYAKLIIIVALKVHSWITLMIIFLLQYPL